MRIVLPPNITEHWLWRDPVKFQWWLLLLQHIADHDCEVTKAGKTYTLRRGEIITSKGELAKLWNTSPDSARSFLRMLESHGEICKCPKVNPKLTQLKVLTLNNYVDVRPEVDPKLTQSYCNDNPEPEVNPTLTRTNSNKSAIKDDACPDDDPILTQQEKEKRKEKESFPPHPPYKEKENKKEKELASNEALSSASQDDSSCGIDFKRLVEFFNKSMAGKLIPQIRDISGKRRQAVKARCKTYGKEAIMEAIINASKSSFLNGNNSRNFRATFDWIFAPSNFPKVLEGNYSDENNQLVNTSNNGSTSRTIQTSADARQQRQSEFANHILNKLARSKKQSGFDDN